MHFPEFIRVPGLLRVGSGEETESANYEEYSRQGVTQQNITGMVSGGLPAVNQPNFKVPRTLKDQQAINPNPTVFTIDPNLRTPYVQQWNL